MSVLVYVFAAFGLAGGAVVGALVAALGWLAFVLVRRARGGR